jgi:predicted AAA+ superfamily ATPase
MAKKDPLLFFENYMPLVILDEIQYVPKLLTTIKMMADENRHKNGQFILTGSQFFPLMAGISESLAGRAGLFELLGFSFKELGVCPPDLKSCFCRIHRGFYPDPAVHHVTPKNYYSAYLTTYLEKDIRQIKSVHDLTIFEHFLELLAARVGSLLNLSEISKECGISHTTARQWLSLLTSTRIVYLLRPYHTNISKRVIKSPKIYFTDTGLLAFLLKYSDSETLAAGPMAGFFFENMIVMEILKEKFNTQGLFELYFFRDSNHNEVDLVIDQGLRKILIEIKMTKTIRMEHAQALSQIQLKIPNSSAYLVSFSQSSIAILKNVRALPWQKVTELFGL